MRPRIKRSITRDGLVDHQVQRENTDNRPRREGNRRPEGGQQRSQGSSGKPGRGFQKRDSRTGKPAQPRTGRNEGGYGNKAAGKGNRTKKTARPGASPEKKFQYRIKTEHPRTENKARILPMKEDDGTVRLNKFIANSGICSRREADGFIQAGLVTVNGEVVTEMGVKVRREDDVRFNGQRLQGEKKVYVLLNKPKDFVTTTSDPHAEKNVMQLISKTLCPERIFPVGRLDKSTTGVLLLTNDGELAEKLTHPSFQKKKIYQVTLDKNVKPEDMNSLVQGISLEDGQAYADEVAYNGDDRSVVGIEIHSGKNRIVRRMFEALGYKVRKLDRVYFAGLTKKNLRRGQWRFLSDEEVLMLKHNFYE